MLVTNESSNLLNQEIIGLIDKINNNSSASLFPILKKLTEINKIRLEKLPIQNFTEGDQVQIKKIQEFSVLKSNYYESRFGFIKKYFSCFRNLLVFGAFMSSALLAQNLCAEIVRAPSEVKPTSQNDQISQLDQAIIEDLNSLIKKSENDQKKEVNLSSIQKQIIIHLDINGTLIFFDGATGKNARECINESLSKRLITYWPNYDKPCSFYDYVYQHVLPGDANDSVLKKQRNEMIGKFEDYVKEQNLPFRETMSKVIEVAEKKIKEFQDQGKNIVPSFYHMVDRLENDNIDFYIQLRTFGKELEQTKAEIEKNTKIQFEKEVVDLTKKDLYENEDIAQKLQENKAKSIDESFSKGHHMVQDNYDKWKAAKFQASGGKPFFVGGNQSSTSIFFDDNAPGQGNEARCIVGPQDLNGNFSNIQDLTKQGSVVKADALEALFDPNYFIEKIVSAKNE
jgi:hypothetical protein